MKEEGRERQGQARSEAGREKRYMTGLQSRKRRDEQTRKMETERDDGDQERDGGRGYR